MSDVNFCPECGTKIEPGWNACPNCGYNLKEAYISEDSRSLESKIPVQEPRPTPSSYIYRPKPYTAPKGYNAFGIVALIFGILGLCCFGIVLGIIALIFGIIGQIKDERKGFAVAGIILGLVDIGCTIFLLYFSFSLYI